MMPLRAIKRRWTCEQENSAKSPGTDTCVPVEDSTKVQRKRKIQCEPETELKKAKVEISPESCTSSPEDLIVVLSTDTCVPAEEKTKVQRKRKAQCEPDIELKKAKVESSPESCTSSPEDELYDVTFQVSTSRADFESKYCELYKMGSGGFGSVFAGRRLNDSRNVAIKHIPHDQVYYKKVVQNGVEYNLIDEVALMVKVSKGNCPAVVSLLDTYDLPEELILVMERPFPSMDLHHYKTAKGGVLKEEEAKVILKQMVEASIQMHNSGVFHRDLKLENILMERGPPRGHHKARVIDFGCGCLVKEGPYDDYAGTFIKAPPEWYSSNAYRAEPTTVFHLGALLYDLLHHKTFNTRCYLRGKRRFDSGLSKKCLNFLKSCLAKDPDDRPSFEELLRHPWFF